MVSWRAMKSFRILSVLFVIAFATLAHAQHVRPVSVALRNDFQGLSMCLDIVNGGPRNNQAEMRPCGAFSGQQWTATPIGNGYYTLTTAFRGANMCLDVVNGGPDNNLVWLQPCGNFSGQHWQITPTRTDRMRLSTEFRGTNVCLDVVN